MINDKKRETEYVDENTLRVNSSVNLKDVDSVSTGQVCLYGKIIGDVVSYR